MAKCEICGREFSTEGALAQHTKDKHGTELASGASSGVDAPQAQKAGRAKGKTLRRRNRHPVALGLVVIAVVLGLGLYVLIAPDLAAPPVPCSTGETYIHVHPYLRIVVNGTDVPIPAGIGINFRGCSDLVVHTHDASGVIHIELSQTDKNANYTLGDFFKVWSGSFSTVTFGGTSHPVVFTNTNIFGLQADSTHQVVVLVDNKTVTNGIGVPLEQLDYCSSNSTASSACGGPNPPYWNGSLNSYPYGTGHTIVIEYLTTG
jgi:hypothetical protein